MNKVSWIESSGGPLILAHKAIAANWSGTYPSQFEKDLTDYQRACAVVDEVGIVNLGEDQVVVFGDEPDRTAIMIRDSVVFVLRWRWAESESAFLSRVTYNLDDLNYGQSMIFPTHVGEHLMFDSSVAGTELEGHLSCTFSSTTHVIETAFYKPDPSLCALVHRIREMKN